MFFFFIKFIIYFDTKFDTFCAFDVGFLIVLIEIHEIQAKIPENPIHLHVHA